MLTGIQARKLSVVRFALAGAMAAGAFYALCWLGAHLPIGPATHLYLQLFTAAETGSLLALVQGVSWSVAFGLVAGGLFSVSYNALAALER